MQYAADVSTVWVSMAGDSAFLGDSCVVVFTTDLEVTQSEISRAQYASVFEDSPSEMEDRNLPQTHVNWFEALLFANAFSKSKNLDTVYSYSEVTRGADGSVYEMAGLKADFSRDGFRLPTEAEWIFLSQKNKSGNSNWSDGSSPGEFAWYLENSGNSVHSVCAKKQQHGLCDINGNVMEWVWDWLADPVPGRFSNYTGSAEPNQNRERVVKGGSFQHDASYFNRSAQRDIYPVTSSTQRDYIGFRLVRGVLDSTSFSSGGQVSHGTPVVWTEPKRVLEFLGKNHAKAVLLNRSTGNLVLAEYEGVTLNTREVTTDHKAYHPVISPDGKWFAYSTRMEGQIAPSEIYVQSWDGTQEVPVGAGAIPRWWVDSAANDTFLVFPENASSNGDSTSWKSWKTYRRSFSGKDGGTLGEKEILQDGTFNGGISADGNTLASGSTRLLVLQGTEDPQERFLSPENGKDAEGSSQVCNVSLSSEKETRMAFIDFGYSRTSALTGGSYGVHEVLFISDLKGAWEYMHVPSPYVGWSHPEWSNHEDYLVSTFLDTDEINRSAGIAKLDAKQVLVIAEGEDLYHPYLWVNPNAEEYRTFADDSLGNYLTPNLDYSVEEMAGKYRLFWLNYQDMEMAIIGSSRQNFGILAKDLSPKTFNFGVAGGDIRVSYEFLKNYLLKHADSLHTVILGLDLDLMVQTNKFWNMLHVDNVGHNYDKKNQFWPEGPPEQLIDRMNHEPVSELMESYILNNGSDPRESNGWKSLWGGRADFWAEDPGWDAGRAYLKEMVQMCANAGVFVVGVITPQTPELNQTDYASVYRLPRTTEAQMLDTLSRWQQEFPNFVVFDEHKSGQHDYVDVHAFDVGHLSETGAKQFTSRLKEFLEQY